MNNETAYDRERESLLVEHVGLLIQGKLDELDVALRMKVFNEHFLPVRDEAFTAERVARKDEYGPLLRRMAAANAARKAGTMSEADHKAEFEKYLQEKEALENEVFPVAMRRFEREVLALAYGDADLQAFEPETREAFLAVFRDALANLAIGYVGIDPEDDGPYE